MKFEELFFVIGGKTDIKVFNIPHKTNMDIVRKGHIITTIKYDASIDSIPEDIRQAEVFYLTAVDYRTVEVGLSDQNPTP